MLSLGYALKQSCNEPSTIPTPHRGDEITKRGPIHERVITLERDLCAANTQKKK